MKILILLPYLPYKNVPHAGGRFTYNLIKEIGKGNEIYGVSFINNDNERSNDINAGDIFKELTKVNLGPLEKIMNFILFPWLPIRFAFRVSPLLIKKLLRYRDKNIDVVIMDHSIMGSYAFILRAIFPKASIVWNMVELSSLSFQRKYEITRRNYARKIILGLEYYKSMLAEKVLFNACDLILTFNSAEIERMRLLGCPEYKIRYIQPHINNLTEIISGNYLSKPNGILFFGKMSRRDNWDAAEVLIREIFPIIKRDLPDAKLYILGAEPPDHLQQLATANNDIVVTGYVEDFRQYLVNIKLAVFPLRMGAGVKFKILDALSWGLPVVTTTIGAEGINNGSPALQIVDNPEKMAGKAIELLTAGKEVYQSLSEQAREHVRMNYDWENSCAGIENISRRSRANRQFNRGAVLWLTGLSGAGKSTIADELQARLADQGCPVFILDGDNIRRGLNKDLGFSADAREENIRRIGEVAKLFAEGGFLVIVAFISPFKNDRAKARDLLPEGHFIEVYVKADLATCEARDPKGLYKKARSGAIADFTGITSPYEEPESPELILETERLSPEQCAGEIIEHLRINNLLPKTGQRNIKTCQNRE